MTQSEHAQNTPPVQSVVRNNRLQLIAIVVIACISLSGSYFLFFKARDGAVWGTTNNGEWVQPAVNSAELALVDSSSGQPVVQESLWGLWVVSEGPCDSACSDAVFQMRQLHVLLNKEADRVRRALIAPRAADAELAEPFPKLARWMLGTGGVLKSGIYIADPHGNLVFRYPLETPGKPVLSDLKRLLKVSQIG